MNVSKETRNIKDDCLEDRVPELRFPEFEGEWDNYCLEDICSFSKGKGISKKNIGKEGIDCICYGELYTVYNELINKTISKTDLSYEDLILSKKNDVIIPSTGETAIDISQTSCITKENDSLQRQTENKDEDSQKIQDNKNIPQLRFPEFTEEWKEVKLENLTKRITRKNKNLETKRPLTISAQKGLINQIEFFGKYVASKNLKGYYLLKKGEFAYNKSYSKGFPYGVIKRLDFYNNGAVSTLYICFEITSKINSDFFKIYFETNKWYKEMYKIAVEGARNHGLLNIPVKDFFNTKHKIPSLEEQEKIAKFLSTIDKKIAFMEKEINKQSKYMKKIREIILNDNSDNSNKVQLKEICIINKGKQLNKTNMIPDGKYYVLNGGKTPSGFTNSWNVPENTISISEGGNSCGFVNYNVQKFYCGGHCYYLTNISDEIDPLLLYHCLKMNENKIMKLKVGSGLPNIQKKDLEKYKLYIPTKNHEKITYLLNNINLKIDLNKEKLNHLKQFKKGLLQKMFC